MRYQTQVVRIATFELRCQGASTLCLNAARELEAVTLAGTLRDGRPYSYQDR